MKLEGGGGKRGKFPDEYDKEGKEIGNIVYVKYADHVLYRNINSEKICPVIRETLGWKINEGMDFIQICWDKSVIHQESEIIDSNSGLLIMKNDILELSFIQIQNLKISEICSYIT